MINTYVTLPGFELARKHELPSIKANEEAIRSTALLVYNRLGIQLTREIGSLALILRLEEPTLNQDQTLAVVGSQQSHASLTPHRLLVSAADLKADKPVMTTKAALSQQLYGSVRDRNPRDGRLTLLEVPIDREPERGATLTGELVMSCLEAAGQRLVEVPAGPLERLKYEAGTKRLPPSGLWRADAEAVAAEAAHRYGDALLIGSDAFSATY